MISPTGMDHKRQRILVVDDDPAILRLVRDKLDRAGYEVVTAVSGAEALEVIYRYGLPHLAIVDLNMPQMNGFELCAKLQQFSDLPILLLTAIDEENTIVRGIERFAEDYVTKPFSPRELKARIERILRRIGDFTYTLDVVTHIDDWLAIDFARQQAFLANEAITLTPLETKLLYILIRNAGRTVTSDFMLRRLWPLEEVFENTLRVQVYRLRHKIEPDPSKPRYIVTERGLGYSFPSCP